MKIPGSLLVVMSTSFLAAAADVPPFLPAIAIEIVEPADPVAYATCVAEINAAMKARHGVPLFLRVYAGEATGDGGRELFSLSPASSFATWRRNQQHWSGDGDLAELRARMEALSAPGPRTLLKAVRFDGTHAPG